MTTKIEERSVNAKSWDQETAFYKKHNPILNIHYSILFKPPSELKDRANYTPVTSFFFKSTIYLNLTDELFSLHCLIRRSSKLCWAVLNHVTLQTNKCNQFLFFLKNWIKYYLAAFQFFIPPSTFWQSFFASVCKVRH